LFKYCKTIFRTTFIGIADILFVAMMFFTAIINTYFRIALSLGISMSLINCLNAIFLKDNENNIVTDLKKLEFEDNENDKSNKSIKDDINISDKNE